MKLKSNFLFFALLLGSAGVVGGCTGEDISSTSSGILDASPPSVKFTQPKVNKKRTQSFVLSNVSPSGTIEIKRLELIETPNESSKRDRKEFSPGKEWLKGGETKKLAPNESMSVQVDYRPSDQLGDQAKLRVYLTGDPNYPDGYMDIDISSPDISPIILTANPAVFDKPVQAAKWACRDEIVQNIGSLPLKITGSVLVSPTGTFHVQYLSKEDHELQPGFCSKGVQDYELGDSLEKILTRSGGKTKAEEVMGTYSQEDGGGEYSIAKDGLPPTHYFYVRYFFLPSKFEADSAQLIFDTNIPRDDGKYTIDVKANPGDRCLEIQPAVINFPDTLAVRPPGSATVQFEIRNCSQNQSAKPIEIKELLIKDEFHVTVDDTTQNNVEKPAPGSFEVSEVIFETDDVKDDLTDSNDSTFVELATNQKLLVTLNFIPEELGSFKGTFVAETTDNYIPEVTAPMNINVNETAKPIAKSYITQTADKNGGIQDFTQGDQPGRKETTVAPQSTVSLTAIANKDELNYEWFVNKEPVGANIAFTSPNNKEQNIQLNLSGEYVFAVVVSAKDGSDASDRFSSSAQVTINVQADSDIYVELTWSRTGSGDRSDLTETYEDPDLHMVASPSTARVRYGWEHPERAVYWRHLTQRIGQFNTKMTLERDDRKGLGPEVISVTDPANRYNYDIGVHYYDDARSLGGGPIYLYIKIFVEGRLIAESGPRLRPAYLHEKEFWYVGYIKWNRTSGSSTPPQFIAINRIYENITEANVGRTNRK